MGLCLDRFFFSQGLEEAARLIFYDPLRRLSASVGMHTCPSYLFSVEIVSRKEAIDDDVAQKGARSKLFI